MQRKSRLGSLMLALCGLCSTSCFVDEGECASNGIDVEPCAVSIKAAGTIEIHATVEGDPSQPVAWGVGSPGECVQSNFDFALTGPNSIRLFSKLALPGSCSLVVRGVADPSRSATVSLGVSSVSYGYPPPPVQVVGLDAPGDQFAAVAAGDGIYYLAYADGTLAPTLALLEGTPGPTASNYFVKQFRLSDNVLLSTLGDQFEGFASGSAVIVPNVAADCLGNGYWFDRAAVGAPFVLNRLAANGVLTAFVLNGLTAVGQVALSCSGTIFFFGTDSQGLNRLYRVTSLAGGTVQFQEFVIAGIPGGIFQYDTLAIDGEERILLGSRSPAGVPLLRVEPDPTDPFTGTLDASFDICQKSSDGFCTQFAVDGPSAIAVDASGVIYAADLGTRIVALNATGHFVYQLTTYQSACPDGCTPAGCPFQNIISLSVSADGRLRVVDDVSTSPCGETVRVILIDPGP